MIIKLNRNHHDRLMNLLKKEPEYNLFIIGDIETYGYDNYFLQLWGEIDENNEINSILMKYFDYMIFYSSKDEYDTNGFIDILQNTNYTELSGKSECIEAIADKLYFSKRRDVNFCELNKSDILDNLDIKYKLKKIRFGNIKKIVKLYENIPEFDNITVEGIKSNLKSGRGYFIENDRKAIAMAKSTAENDTHAMVIGVGTHKMHRGHGYATDCMIKLCSELLKENKKVCLFYDDEQAGRIYEKLGFEIIGKWSILLKYPKILK